jgi:hypothetical protein
MAGKEQDQMDEKDTGKKAPEGDELNAEELETVTGALSNFGGFGGGPGGVHNLTSPSCTETTDTGMMGCSG